MGQGSEIIACFLSPSSSSLSSTIQVGFWVGALLVIDSPMVESENFEQNLQFEHFTKSVIGESKTVPHWGQNGQLFS